MDELHNELHRHYGLLLGVKSPWGVKGVNLDMAGRRVDIRLEWAMGTPWPVRTAASNARLPTMRRSGRGGIWTQCGLRP